MLLLTIFQIKTRNIQCGGYSGIADYCARALNISEDQAWKRSRAATVIGAFPEFLEAFVEGKITVSNLAVIAGKITQANCEQFFAFLPGKSKREVEAYTRRMGFNGELAPETDDEVEFSVRIPRSLLEAIEDELHHLRRSRAGSKCSSKDELKRLLLEKACVHRKTENCPGAVSNEQPKRERQEPDTSASCSITKDFESPLKDTCLGAGDLAGPPASASRYIPAATRRAVERRDGGQCTFISDDGVRCTARHYLEMDHVLPFAWGGGHEVDNLRLLCRAHNQLMSEDLMGKAFMERMRADAALS